MRGPVFLHRGAALRADLPPQLAPVLARRAEHRAPGRPRLARHRVRRDRAGRVHILQVRPIAVTRTRPADRRRRGRRRGRPRPGGSSASAQRRRRRSSGRTTRYSVMTDWNPAEIIGTESEAPRDDVVPPSRHRRGMGAAARRVRLSRRAPVSAARRDRRPSVRRCARIVQLVRARLAPRRSRARGSSSTTSPNSPRIPSLHDKVEFDVVFTCLTVDFDKQADAPRRRRLRRRRDRSAPRRRCGRSRDCGFERLGGRPRASSPCSTRACKPYGTRGCRRSNGRSTTSRRPAGSARSCSRISRAPPSSRPACCARSRTEGVISAAENGDFLASIETVLGPDAGRRATCRDGRDSAWDEFVDRYGHLRPGPTTSRRRAIARPRRSTCDRSSNEPVSSRAARAVGRLEHHDAPGDPRRPAARACLRTSSGSSRSPASAIAGREEAKFVFTKPLSEALECLAAVRRVERADARRPRARRHRGSAGVPRRDERPRELPGAARLEGRETHNVAQGVCLPGPDRHRRGSRVLRTAGRRAELRDPTDGRGARHPRSTSARAERSTARSC